MNTEELILVMGQAPEGSDAWTDVPVETAEVSPVASLVEKFLAFCHLACNKE